MKAGFKPITINDMPQNIRAVVQLAVFKARKSHLIEYMQKNIKREVDIEEVRSRLARISTSLSEELIDSRAERI